MGAFLISSLNCGVELLSAELLFSSQFGSPKPISHDLQSSFSLCFGDCVSRRWRNGKAFRVFLWLSRESVFKVSGFAKWIPASGLGSDIDGGESGSFNSGMDS